MPCHYEYQCSVARVFLDLSSIPHLPVSSPLFLSPSLYVVNISCSSRCRPTADGRQALRLLAFGLPDHSASPLLSTTPLTTHHVNQPERPCFPHRPSSTT